MCVIPRKYLRGESAVMSTGRTLALTNSIWNIPGSHAGTDGETEDAEARLVGSLCQTQQDLALKLTGKQLSRLRAVLLENRAVFAKNKAFMGRKENKAFMGRKENKSVFEILIPHFSGLDDIEVIDLTDVDGRQVKLKKNSPKDLSNLRWCSRLDRVDIGLLPKSEFNFVSFGNLYSCILPPSMVQQQVSRS